MLQCECPYQGGVPDSCLDLYDEFLERPFVNHESGQCKCTNNLNHYLRRGKTIVLCSCCVLLGDKVV